ncbi:MAG: polysaccharide biosynthesis/export family protein [Bryobacterales bacterium]|nr:polysaccharide biosynthesis/export family protein [Bryobacterales bacterium]
MNWINGRGSQYFFLALLLMHAAVADDKLVIQKSSAEVPIAYVLQADDEITVHSLQAKEIAEKTFRVDQNGEVKFPMAGVVHLAGSTVRDAEQRLATALKTYYFDPDIEITVMALHSEPVSVLGAVGAPGVYQLKGQTHLLEALSIAGGVRGDAGAVAILTRQGAYGAIPHRDARQTLSGESVVEIDLKSLMEAQSSSENVLIEPHDVISIPPAQLVYVIGNVKKAGGFPLGGRPTLSVIQALALAEGLDPRAAPERARILRRGAPNDQQIPVDMKKILAGKTEDVVLRPNDILFVPSSAMKTVTTRAIETAIQIGTGLAIFRP